MPEVCRCHCSRTGIYTVYIQRRTVPPHCFPFLWEGWPEKMKLLTHNMLTSHVRGVRPGGGFPLRIQATEVKVNTVDFNPEFTARMVPKVEWEALVEAAESLGHRSDLPSAPIPDYESNEDFLRKVHHVLMEVEVVEGVLQCPDTGREFPITKGIPNMLLSEEET